MLYLDVPAGTGYSTGKQSFNDKEVALIADKALRAFLLRFTDIDLSDHKITLAGEGYAGTLIPFIA